jgi:serine/threonine protein kinase
LHQQKTIFGLFFKKIFYTKVLAHREKKVVHFPCLGHIMSQKRKDNDEEAGSNKRFKDTEHILGEGSNGRICMVEHNNTFVAVKTFPNLKGMTLVEEYGEAAIQAELTELAKKENFNFILRLVGEGAVPSTVYTEKLFMEVGQCSLHDIIHSKRCRFNKPEEVCRQYLLPIALAVQFMHKHEIVHLDLKPGNIIVVNRVLKVADFGSAIKMVGNQNRIDKEYNATTFIYATPEYFADEDYDPYAVDLWSLGIMLFEMLTVSYPWEKPVDGDEWFLAWKNDNTANNWNFLKRKAPETHAYLCEHMLHLDPKLRSSVGDIIQFCLKKPSPPPSVSTESNVDLACSEKSL